MMLSFQLSMMETVHDKASSSPRRQAPRLRGDLSASAGDAVRSSASPGQNSDPASGELRALRRISIATSSLLLRHALETTGATKSSAMCLEGKSSPPTSRCGDIGCWAMPRPTTNRSNDALLVRPLGISIRCMLIVFRIVPIGDPLPDVSCHILHPIG